MLAARWRVALVVCATTLVWLSHYDRWTIASWSLPTDYHGDSLEILARIKAAAEGDTVPLRPQVISRLGAPFGANWSAYPSSDLLLLWVVGLAARLIGVYPAANAALLLAALSSALAFYGCARWLRARWEWAFAGALLFAFTFQTFHRGLAHLLIVFSWTVPLALLSCGLIAGSQRLRLRSASGLFCLVTAGAIGIGNPYVLFLFLQLLGWAIIAQWLRGRRRENLLVGGLALAIAFTAFFIVEAHVWIFTTDTAAASPIVRNYGGTERYALKPIELLLPSASHRWDGLAFFGQRYVRWSDWRTGEAFATYLGVVGIAGLLWVAIATLRAVMQRRRLPGISLPLGWVFAFASVGGITNILAFFTTVVVFRATNRYSIFISALVLLFIALRMSRVAHAWRRSFSVGIAALVVSIGLADQLPQAPDCAAEARVARRVESDRDLATRLERELPPRAMVFQLPVIGFPEVVPPYQLSDYEHFRPYLATKTLRFTYGSLKGRSRGRWQRELGEMPIVDMVQRLEQYGFAAIYLNRRGFADRAEKLLADLAQSGRARRLVSKHGDQVVVFLNPTKDPVIPIARTLTFGWGWHERPGLPRWAFGTAALSYFNPHAEAIEAKLELVVSSAGRRDIQVYVNDALQMETALDETLREVVVPVTFRPGANRIEIKSPQGAIRVANERDGLRTLAVHKHAVRLPEEVLQRRVSGSNVGI